MTGTRASTSVLALAACLVLWNALMMQSVHAQDAGLANRTSADTIHFDLPAQPLAQVLQAFGRMTELVVVVPRPLLDGRISAPISGDYLPSDALRRVLAGTGLGANFIGADEAMIAPLAASQQPSLPADFPLVAANAIDGVMAGGDYRSYVAMIQTRLTSALCASALTRPENYRLALQLLIDEKGTVTSANLLDSSGLPERDTAIERTLRTLVLDSPPPAGFPEPITILLRPAGNGVRVDCTQADGQGA
jgi:hypothetical protein